MIYQATFLHDTYYVLNICYILYTIKVYLDQCSYKNSLEALYTATRYFKGTPNIDFRVQLIFLLNLAL